MLLVALDPGYTTGWAIFRKGAPERYTSGQVKGGCVEMYHHLNNMQAAFGTPDLIIYENFKYRQLPKADLTPVETIGAIKIWAHFAKVNTYDQLPAVAVGKSAFWTDERLKKLGLYKASQVHANDAMRHLLYYLGFGPGVQIGEDNVRRLR